MPALIIRLPNWLGDTVMAVPLVRAARASAPDARLVLVGPWASVLAGQGLGDVLVDYPRSWGGRLRTADSVRELRAEAALLLPKSFEAAAMARYWGARRRVGFNGGGRGWLLTDRLPVPAPRCHQVDEYLSLGEPLAIRPITSEPQLAPPASATESRARARALLRQAGFEKPGRGPVVGVHLGAVYGPSKLWPAEHVAEFCGLMSEGGGMPVLLGPGDAAEFAARVTRLSPVASLVGRDTPEILPALLAELDGVICGDTGVGHLAAALGTPVVALFGPTDPALTAPRGPVAVMTHHVPCAPCFYRTCPIDHPCMRGIEPRAVRDALSRLLSGRRAPRSTPVAGGHA